ncbi:hypothetical protein E2C01_031387 [Portunus trituberculatus]|uniref:Uncharacterized protein n=1 Tax=Portunus trituberculatus TaxID=210409 RepID=A0A5B7EYF4_PORTR|nr:hypothetical protein [Portunus trituberculatus]
MLVTRQVKHRATARHHRPSHVTTITASLLRPLWLSEGGAAVCEHEDGSTWREGGREVGECVVVVASGLQCAPHLSAHYLATERGYSQSRPLPRLRKSLAYRDWGGRDRGEGLQGGGRRRGGVMGVAARDNTNGNLTPRKVLLSFTP